MRHWMWAGVTCLGLATGTAHGQSLNLYGNVGLVDMPSAAMAPDGTLAFSYGLIGDSTGRATINFQLTPRVEGSLRYSAIEGWDAPGVVRSDKQFDLKVQLLEETATLPAIAIGARDLLGSGIYSSEYIVATKTIANDFRVTGGLGWGRLAGRAAFDNPFGGVRSNAPGGREQFNTANFFQGPDVGVFGGVEWTPGGTGFRLKAEYSSDNYAGESAFGALTQKSAWNFGVERSVLQGVDVGAYYLHGNEFGLRVSFTADPGIARTPQDLLNGPPPFVTRPEGGKRGTNWAARPEYQQQLMTALGEALAGEGVRVEAAALSGTSADVHIVNERYSRATKAVGRTARILAVGLPHSIETFNITLVEGGLPVTTVTINRSDMEQLVDTHEAVPESWRRFALSSGAHLDAPTWERGQLPKFSYALAPRIPFSLFNGGFDFDVRLAATANYQITPGLSLSGEVTQSLLGRLGGPATAPGTLPQVRSNYATYQSDTPVVERLTADYVAKLSPSIYARASGGYLERMFAGVSGELLYKDATSPFGVGMELNYVMQRDPKKVFGITDYDTVTGFGSLYWDTGWKDVHAQVDAGRFLAGDWGATLTVSRRFANGWEVAGYLTGTDADTSALAGGDFDKGIRLTIPLQWTFPQPTRRKITVPFADLARDDGARLDIANRLYPTMRDAEAGRLAENWSAFWQ